MLWPIRTVAHRCFGVDRSCSPESTRWPSDEMERRSCCWIACSRDNATGAGGSATTADTRRARRNEPWAAGRLQCERGGQRWARLHTWLWRPSLLAAAATASWGIPGGVERLAKRGGGALERAGRSERAHACRGAHVVFACKTGAGRRLYSCCCGSGARSRSEISRPCACVRRCTARDARSERVAWQKLTFGNSSQHRHARSRGHAAVRYSAAKR